MTGDGEEGSIPIPADEMPLNKTASPDPRTNCIKRPKRISKVLPGREPEQSVFREKIETIVQPNKIPLLLKFNSLNIAWRS